MNTTPQHVDAMKLDPRVQYIGTDWDKCPQRLIDMFPDWLNGTYTMMGQAVNRLAIWEPALLDVD
jgi:hypothetical protein